MDNAEFPEFSDADTILKTPDGHVWKLHKFQLARNCPTLHKMFTDGSLTKFNDSGGDMHITYRVYVRPIETSSCLAEFVPMGPESMDKNTQGETHQLACYRAHNNFFRLLYEMEPELTDSDDLDGTINELVYVLEVAENLGALKVVRKPIETFLVSAMGFWKRVADAPVYWADIACRLQSSMVFKEAMCHYVGQFGFRKSSLSKIRPPDLQYSKELDQLCIDKYNALQALKIVVEQKVLHFYPESMKPGPSAGNGGAKRSIYANNIYQWQSLLLIRQWMTRGICNKEHHLSEEDGGVAFYRKLGKGGDSYVDEAYVNGFHQTFPMSSKGQEIFRNAIYAVKDQISPLLHPLLVDRSIYGQSLPGGQKLPYLTCSVIADSELPWMAKVAAYQKASVDTRKKPMTREHNKPVYRPQSDSDHKTVEQEERHVADPNSSPRSGEVQSEPERPSYTDVLPMQQVATKIGGNHALEQQPEIGGPPAKRSCLSEGYTPILGNGMDQSHMMGVGMNHIPMMMPSSGVNSALRVTQQQDINREITDGSNEISHEAILQHMGVTGMSVPLPHEPLSFDHINGHDSTFAPYGEGNHLGGRKRDWHDAN